MFKLTGRLARARVLIAGVCLVVGLWLRWAVGSCPGYDKKAQQAVLTEEGEAKFAIVAMGTQGRRPAEELALYLERISSTKVRVEVLGGSPHPDPPEEYLDRHPEYYALVDGKRGARQGKKGRIQLCTSNTEVVKEVAARIVKMREADPSLRMISLDPMDTPAFCECPNCRALDEQGAGPMKEYYEALEAAALASGVHLARQCPYEEVIRLFTPDLLDRLDGCVKRAEKAAQDGRVKARIDLVRASLDCAKVCSEYLRALQKVRQEGGLPWAAGAVLERANAVGASYVGKIKAALEKGREIRATK